MVNVIRFVKFLNIFFVCPLFIVGDKGFEVFSIIIE